jgi:23S rRNA (cytosine1962-C5)-methyltransferase
VDRLGDYLLSHSETPLDARQAERLRSFATAFTQHATRITAAYHRLLLQNAGQATTTAASPQLVFGQPAPARFTILENGLRYELSFNEGYSVGLFLDQRDNRRRFLVNHVAANFPLFPEGAAGCEVLNTFAYTCGFSLCAAQAGARATSVDLSKKYLAWGQRNFALNDLDPSAHDFIYGDAFEWLGRLARKPRRFDVIVLDPPTFSRSKEWGAFQAQMDYPKLLRAAVPLLKAQGVLLACTNAAGWQTEEFVANVEQTIAYAGRGIAQRHYAPQPPDFPISREEPAHLKTLWLRIN